MNSRITPDHVIISTPITAKQKPWAAMVQGLDEEKGLDRGFLGVSLTAIDAATSARTASIRLPRLEGTIYELGQWNHDDQGNEKRYYIRIVDTKPTMITLEEVKATFADSAELGEDIEMPF